jgi:phage gp16-like protein
MSMLWDPTLTVPAKESTVQLPTRVRDKLTNPFNIEIKMSKKKEEVAERMKEVWAPTIPTFVASPPSKQDTAAMKGAKVRKPEAVGKLFDKVARRRLEVMHGHFYRGSGRSVMIVPVCAGG